MSATGYKVQETQPLHITYKNKFKVYSTPAPSSGSIVLSALNILGHFEDVHDVHSEVTIHRTAEAMKVRS
jgi:gamma-glutamyltranspeptidase/glutathione hydrolase